MLCSAMRTSGLFLLLFLIINTQAVYQPWIFTASVNKSQCENEKCVLNLNIQVSNVDLWSLTRSPASRGQPCSPTIVKDVNDNDLIVGVDEKLFFCVQVDGVWIHQGLYLEGDVIEAG